MRVLVTGGTGFVGSHTVAALAGAGHDVRLLVRDRGRVARALDPLAVEVSDVALGDVTDRAAVEEAVQGCDAVVHAASVVSLDVRQAARILEVNRGAAENVLGAAAAAGCDPIVHVSSIAALTPLPAGEVLTAQSPVPEPKGGYGRSKAAAEKVARRLQDEGAPVVTVYPTMVAGPNDPNVGEGATAFRNLLRGLMPVMPPGGMHIIDVRDLAAVHTALLDAGRGARRYLVAGHHVTTREVVAAMARVTGRRLRVGSIPVGLAVAGGRLVDRARRFVPIGGPMHLEGVETLTSDPPCDDAATWEDLGLRPRPLDETLADTVRWMVDAGLISRSQAGLAAP
jgi:dihydroflavonol-4-reductase